MTYLERMQQQVPYVANAQQAPQQLQQQAKHLCWQLNQLDPTCQTARQALMTTLFGTVQANTFVMANFNCDYGFNIHFQGFAYVNDNCTILDTSPVIIGAGAFLAPGVVLACAGHALVAEQRAQGVSTSAPITLAENVWLGANTVVAGGVTIGAGSVIGANSFVNRDIPAGVVAVGSPCQVLRPVTAADRLQVEQFDIK
ncbi:sugar O-acetyltransferase [Loigolactobacillus bifermentans]|uniref:Acetyltransferase n=1 Tax=Loigolactobacillus bifermentans DSM 20003 TaxID=1423726 RepID=A0A0R1H463_9LACO|nr:sugar O-acetyltransferase [Loigolactobacillus bifermentans]KRK40777.1 hypothetical protein FC07_GL002526 [Loigolactobacillus bifermentans DSM 20003]QGG59528.1 sugar O-acetyltransferase [Loigolactobacillus bifermentans]